MYKIICSKCAEKLDLENDFNKSNLRELNIEGSTPCMQCGKINGGAEVFIPSYKEQNGGIKELS